MQISTTVSWALCFIFVAAAAAAADSCNLADRLSCGTGMTCAIEASTDRKICFGNDKRLSTCPDINSIHTQQQDPEAVLPRYRSVSAGFSHGCGLTLDNHVRCWGYGDVAAAVPGTYSVLSSSRYVNCAIHADNSTLKCWGDKLQVDQDLLGAVPEGEFTQVDVGRSFGCAVRKADSKVLCWPGNVEHEYAKVVRTGSEFACSLDDLGKVSCWIRPSAKDNPTMQGIVNTTVLFEDVVFTDLAAGRDYVCGITQKDKAVKCWAATQTHPIFTDLPSGQEFDAIVAGGDHACAAKNNGSVYCWPLNDKDGSTAVPANLVICPAGTADANADNNSGSSSGGGGGSSVSIVFGVALSLMLGFFIGGLFANYRIKGTVSFGFIYPSSNAPTMSSSAGRKFEVQSGHGHSNDYDDDGSL